MIAISDDKDDRDDKNDYDNILTTESLILSK